MEKIVKLERNGAGYLASAQRKYDEGRIIDAIADYHSAIALDPDNYTAYSEMASAFEDIGCRDGARPIFMKMIVLDPKRSDGYVGMLAYGTEAERFDITLYYLHLGIVNGALKDAESIPQPTERTFEPEPAPEPESRFHLYDGGDSESTRIAKSMLFNGKYDVALGIYEGIDKNSKDYVEAQAGIILTLYSMKRYDDCVEKCDEFLKSNPKSLPVLSTKMLALFEAGKFDEAYAAGDDLDAVGVETEQDVYTVAISFMKAQDDDYAAKYFEKVLEYRPFDRDAMLIIAQAEYNLGMQAEAREDAMILRKLYPDDATAAYYAKQIVLGKIKEFDLSPSLPERVKKAREKRVDDKFRKLDGLDKALAELETDKEFRDDTIAVMRERDSFIGVSVAKFLCQSEKWQPFIRDLLLNQFISDESRREILHAYLCSAADKHFELVIGDMVLFFHVEKPDVDDTPEEEETFWRVTSMLAFLTNNFEQPLRESYSKIVSALRAAKIGKCNPNALAALIFYDMKIGDYTDKRICCELFEASISGFNTLMSKTGLKEVRKTEESESDTDENNDNKEKK